MKDGKLGNRHNSRSLAVYFDSSSLTRFFFKKQTLSYTENLKGSSWYGRAGHFQSISIKIDAIHHGQPSQCSSLVIQSGPRLPTVTTRLQEIRKKHFSFNETPENPVKPSQTQSNTVKPISTLRKPFKTQ